MQPDHRKVSTSALPSVVSTMSAMTAQALSIPPTPGASWQYLAVHLEASVRMDTIRLRNLSTASASRKSMAESTSSSSALAVESRTFCTWILAGKPPEGQSSSESRPL